MKFYTSPIGPNPQALAAMLKYKGMEDIPSQEIDMLKGENREAAYLKINPLGQLPALELDTGETISELPAIAEYLEELRPDPVFCGNTAQERAATRMWTRRADYIVIAPMMLSFRHGPGAEFFKNRIRIEPDVSKPIGAIAQDGFKWFDAQLADGRSYLCGDRFSYADIVFYSMLAFFTTVTKTELTPKYPHLGGYVARLKESPCFA